MGFKGREKPRGKLGIVRLGSNPSYRPLNLPSNKPGIERFMLASALAWARIVNKDLYGLVKPPVQNLENDFDFTLHTRNGKQFLDLMEAAPLECFGNSYESVPNVVNAGEFADTVYSLIKRKNDKYGGMTMSRLHLMIYSADWRLSLAPSVLTLLEHWLRAESHTFASVVYYLPAAVVRPLIHVLYPSDEPDLEGESEERVRSRMIGRGDFADIRKHPDGQTGFGVFRANLSGYAGVRMCSTGHAEFERAAT